MAEIIHALALLIFVATTCFLVVAPLAGLLLWMWSDYQDRIKRWNS